MDSDASDGDDLTDLDIETFSLKPVDVSTTNAGYSSHSEDSQALQGMWNQRESPDFHRKEVLYGIKLDQPPDQDAFFILDSELAVNESSTDPDNINLLPETNCSHFDLQETQTPTPMIDPFSEDSLDSDERDIQFPSKNSFNSEKTHAADLTYSATVNRKEYVQLNRQPGENLGMVLGIDGDQDNRRTINAVIVKSVTPGGAVFRAGDSNNRMIVGDEISEINGRRLDELTHDECISVLQDMPDNVLLTILRKQKSSGSPSRLPPASTLTAAPANGVPVPRPRKHSAHADPPNLALGQLTQNGSNVKHFQADTDCQVPIRNDSIIDYKVPKGFRKLDLTLYRDEENSLGLSIVPSYGATCDLYQIKRFLHSGACARPGLLKPGDRLLACNDRYLKGLTQAQCLKVLKDSGNFVNLTILRNSSDSQPDSGSGDTPGHISTSPDYEIEDVALHSSWIDSVDSSDRVTEQRIDSLDSSDRVTEQRIDSLDSSDRVAEQRIDSLDSSDRVTEHGIYSLDISDKVTEQRIDSLDSSDRVTEHGIDSLLESSDRVTEHEFYISQPLEDTLINFDDISDDESLEDIQCSANENNKCLVNEDDIELVDAETDKVVTNVNPSFETTLQTDSCLSISPSVNYPGTGNLEYIEFDENYDDTSVSFTNIDDLLFETVDGDSTRVVCNSDFNKSTDIDTTTQHEDLLFEQVDGDSTRDFCNSDRNAPKEIDTTTQQEDLLLISFEQKSEETSAEVLHNHYPDHTDGTFFPQSPDTFDRVCPINQELLLDGTETEQESDVSARHRSEPTIATRGKYTLDTHGGEGQGLSSSPNLTVIPVSAVSSSGEYSSEINLSSVNEREIPNFSDVLFPSGPLTQPSFKTNISVNSQPTVNVSHIDVLSDKSTFQENPSIENINDAPGSTVFHVPGHISSHSLTSATIKVGRTRHMDVAMDNQLTNAVALTTVGVTCRSGEGEEAVTPMVVVKDYQGTPLCIPSTQEHSSQVRILNNDSKREMTEVLLAITNSAHRGVGLDSVSNEIKNEVSEQEIVPTLLTNDQREVMLDVLSQWTSEDKSNKGSAFQKKVSGVMNSRRQPDLHFISENALDHTKLGVSNNSLDNNMFAPVTEVSDHQVKHKHAASPAMRPGVNAMRTLDNNPSTDIDHVIMSLNENTTTSSLAFKPAKADEISDIFISPQVKYDFNQTEVREIENVSFSSTTENRAYSIHDTRNDQDKFDTNGVKVPNTEQLPFRPEIKSITKSTVSEQTSTVSSQSSSHVVLRSKPKPSDDYHQQPADTDSSSKLFLSRRPKSMVEASPFTSRSDDRHTSFATESKPAQTLRSLSALRPLSASTASINHLGSGSSGRPTSAVFSSSTLAARLSKSDYPKTRQEDGSPFQVDVLKGIVGLGFKVKVTPEGHTIVTEIQPSGPIHKDGQVRVGDCLLFINSTELTGQTDARVQQILRLLPRGLTKLVVASVPPASFSESQHSIDSSSYGQQKDQSSSLVTGRGSLSSVHTSESIISENKRTHLPPPVISSAEISPRVTQGDVSEQAPLTATSQKCLESANVMEKPVPAVKSDIDVIRPKATPRQVGVHSLNERRNVSDEIVRLGDSQNLTGTNVLNAGGSSNLTRQAEEEIGFSLSHPLVNESTDVKHEVKESHPLVKESTDVKHEVKKSNPLVKESTDEKHEEKEPLDKTVVIPQQMEAHSVSLQETGPVPNNVQIATTLSAPVSLDSKYVNTQIEDNTREMYQAKESIRHPPVASQTPPKIEDISASLGESVHDSNQDQITSSVLSSLPPTSEAIKKRNTTQLQENSELSAADENLESERPRPHKIPPPVAPKPRLSTTFLVKSQDSVDGAETTKPAVRTSAIYERLQRTTHIQRPSALGDKAGSFVSSTAKMFDNKAGNSDSESEQPHPTRRVSRSVIGHTDSNKATNISLAPAQERPRLSQTHRSISLSQPVIVSSLPRSRTAIYKEVTEKEVIPQESSLKSKESFDDKNNSLLNQARLNAALSPRKASSFDSPNSPPITFSIKHAPMFRNESLDKAPDGKNQTTQQSDIFKSTTLTLVTNKSPSNVSRKINVLPHNDHSSHVVTTEHPSTPPTSPFLSPTVYTNDESFQETMLTFDNLSMDTSAHHIETNSHDLLLQFADKNDDPQPIQIVNNNHSPTADVKKPVALPRRKPEPTEREIDFQVTKNNEAALAPQKREIKELNVEEEGEELLVEVHGTETIETNKLSDQINNQLCDSIDSSDLSIKVASSSLLPAENIPNKMTDIQVTSLQAGQDSQQPGVEYKMAADLLEGDNNHLTASQAKLRQNDLQLIREDAFDLVVQDQEHDEGIVGCNRVSRVDSHTGNMVAEVGYNEKVGTSEDDIELEALNEKASEIVQAVLSRIQNNPHIVFEGQDTTVQSGSRSEQTWNNEHQSDFSFSLPGTPPPLSSDPPPLSSDDPPPLSSDPPPLPGTPPPLPCAPPPPLFPREADHFASTQNFVGHNESTDLPRHITGIEKEPARLLILDQFTNRSYDHHVDTTTESFKTIQPYYTHEDAVSRTSSLEPLYSSGGSFHFDDDTGLDSPSTGEVLSEDSGLLADEDHETPASGEIVPPDGKKVSHLTEDDFEWFTSSTQTQEYCSLITPLEPSSQSPADAEALFKDDKLNEKSDNILENDSFEESLPPPMLPLSVSINDCDTTTKQTNNLLSQTFMSPVQGSISPSVNLLGNISISENTELLQDVASSAATSETKPELPFKSTQPGITSVAVTTHPGTHVTEHDVMHSTGNNLLITSNRKWCLISSRSTTPVLSGEPYVPVQAESTVVRSLAARDLKSAIDKANGVLDAASASNSLSILVVHLNKDEVGTLPDIHLRHEGGIWFEVSGATKSNWLFEKCAVESGDWLVSIDDLWCDHVTLKDFHSKLTSLKQNSLMVLARGVHPGNAKANTGRPVPSPRQRSVAKHGEDEAVLNIAHDSGLVAATVESSRDQGPTKNVTNDGLTEGERQQELPAQNPNTLPQHYLLNEALSVTSQLSSNRNGLPQQPPDQAPPLPDQAPPLPEWIQSLPERTPPLPEMTPPLPEKTPPLPERAPPLPERTPPLPERTPPLPEKTPPLPEKTPPLPERTTPLPKPTPPLPEWTPPLPERTPPLPERVPPLSEWTPLLPEQIPPLPKRTPPLPEQTPPLPERTQPLPERTPSLPEQTPPLPERIPPSSEQTQLLREQSPLLPVSPISDIFNHREANSSKEKTDINRTSVNSKTELGQGIHKVIMIKGATGVGFCLEGGVGSPKGDVPVIIKRIFKGGPAEKCGGLKVRDEILEVNGVQFGTMRHHEAWNHLKFLDDGEVHITIRRS